MSSGSTGIRADMYLDLPHERKRPLGEPFALFPVVGGAYAGCIGGINGMSLVDSAISHVSGESLTKMQELPKVSLLFGGV